MEQMCTEENVKDEMTYIANFYRNVFSKKFRCVLPPRLLEHTVISYLKDLDRLNDFHKLSYPDKHKQAAHIMYWFCKLKPLHIMDSESNLDNKSNFNRPSAPFINEIFAFSLALARMGIRYRNISGKCFVNFLYMLHYREIRPEPLYMMMYLLEQSANGQNS